jgi:hypothetical protein
MDVGNIITSSKLEEDNFKLCGKLESTNKSLPTLIIGWGKTKEMFGENVSILHKQIDDNLYWTFSQKERLVEYENDIIDFKKLCFNKFGDELHYVYVDIIHGKLSTFKKILSKIYSLEESISYITDKNMLYILGDNIIFGIDLNIIEFIGVPINKVITKIQQLPNSVLIENEIFNKCKEFIKKLDNRYRLVPYIIKYGRYT